MNTKNSIRILILFVLSLIYLGFTSCGDNRGEVLNRSMTTPISIDTENFKRNDTIYRTFAGDFKEHIVIAELDGETGLYDTITKKCLTSIVYDEISFFPEEGYVYFVVDEKYGFLDTTGIEIIPAQYDFTTGYLNGLAPIKLNDKWGYINKKGEIVIPIEFDMAWTFHIDNRAAVKKNGKWGFINHEGEYVIEPVYDDVSRTFESSTQVANVSIKSHHFFIDTNGVYLKDSEPYKKWKIKS